MPRISRQELADLRSQSEELQRMQPFLEVAEVFKGWIDAYLEEEHITGSQIGNLALLRTVETQRNKLTDHLVEQYEHQNRQELYKKALKEVEAKEGQTIFEAVIERMESDAKLAKELRESAREEIMARAHTHVSERLSAEQQSLVDYETQRQIDFDRLDVLFALEGGLDLDPAVTDQLTPFDVLQVLFEERKPGRAGVEFVWREDVNGIRGWTVGEMLEANNRYGDQYTRAVDDTSSIPSNRFVRVGTMIPDLELGKDIFVPDKLAARYPLAVSWTDEDKVEQHVVIAESYRHAGDYRATTKESMISAIDFKTRSIDLAPPIESTQG